MNIRACTHATETVSYTEMANAIRALSMDAIEAARSGHPGMPMGLADVATVLFARFLKFDPAKPDWPDRDRFVLSGGHGSMMLYALAHLLGFDAMTMNELKRFRQMGSRTPGHPERDIACGIEATTGPLGQGLGNAVGMAIAETQLRARYPDLTDHYTYAFCGDGDLMEGISHEACSLAGHLKLDRCIVLFDDNEICIDGPTSMSVSDDTTERFLSYGWHVQIIDGHDQESISDAIANARADKTRPSLIRCKTTIAYGAPSKAGTAAAHGSPLGASEIA
ncbi:MAG: 1-deoxy-D-xylulose-5-phosphate synthase N-terminal domain-containing protein, partial [Pseudomonadota bacterium]|nr:1-deoxy-D-xylulose-5-phosphate synthase N-terminal domain-containing protein [Pseudomonadota bacterium]